MYLWHPLKGTNSTRDASNAQGPIADPAYKRRTTQKVYDIKFIIQADRLVALRLHRRRLTVAVYSRRYSIDMGPILMYKLYAGIGKMPSHVVHFGVSAVRPLYKLYHYAYECMAHDGKTTSSAVPSHHRAELSSGVPELLYSSANLSHIIKYM